MTHFWDEIHETETVLYGNYPSGAHESLLRAYRILSEVKAMLERGDSDQTVLNFIAWAESR